MPKERHPISPKSATGSSRAYVENGGRYSDFSTEYERNRIKLRKRPHGGAFREKPERALFRKYLYVPIHVEFPFATASVHVSDDAVHVAFEPRTVMESCDGPKHSHVTVGRPSVQRVPVVQPQRDTVGFGGRIRPFQNLFGPVHAQVRRDLSGRDEFVLAGVPKIVVRFAVFELRFAVGRNPGIRRMRGKARQSPGRRSIERVVRILLMEAEILRQLAADEVFFRKRFLVLVGGGRGIHCQYRFFGRQISVAEMGGKSGRGAGIGVIAPVGVSGKPEFDEVCQKFASFGLPSPESGNRSDRTVAIRGFEFFGDGSGGRSSVTYGQIRQFRARDPFRKNELLPKFGTQRPRSDFEFVAHGPRRNGASGVDFENGNS